MSNYKIPDHVRNIITECKVVDTAVILPDRQLDRLTYEEVNKALVDLGGKWKKGKGHVFATDPTAKIAELLATGVAVDEKKKYQSLYTPDALAKELVELADIQPGDVVLEPSAGDGNIAVHLARTAAGGITCVELNPEAVVALQARLAKLQNVIIYPGDFLRLSLKQNDFDRAVMNPPFTRNQDIQHVEHALRLVRPGGTVVAIMSPNTQRTGFRKLVHGLEHEVIEVPEGTFSESGTPIKTIILKVVK